MSTSWKRDDEFDAADGFDDDDDASWKVRPFARPRRSIPSSRPGAAAICWRAVCSTTRWRLPSSNGSTSAKRTSGLEVISVMSLLVRKTGQEIIPDFSLDASQSELVSQLPASRKRRRQSSGGRPSSMLFAQASSPSADAELVSPTTEKIPTTGPRARSGRTNAGNHQGSDQAS